MVEHFLGKKKVAGSIPALGSMNTILSFITGIFFSTQTAAIPMLSTPVNLPQTSFAYLQTKPQVLGKSTHSAPFPQITNIETETITIAVLGDSMVDTLGPFIELQDRLTEIYPTLEVNVLNYGVGASNIDYGIERITKNYEYLGKKYPSVASTQPDIIVLESFAYNPFPEVDSINRHWLALARAKDEIKAQIPNAKLILATTVAPNSKMFGKGAEGFELSEKDREEKTRVIKEYLQSTIRFSISEKIPLADTYTLTLQSDGNGDQVYINPVDNIHPSDVGRNLFAQTIVQTIVEEGMIQ